MSLRKTWACRRQNSEKNWQRGTSMKKILQLLHRKIDGKSIRLIFTALFFLTVSLFTALIISLYSEYTKGHLESYFLQEKNTQQLRRMSFSIEEDVDDTIELANTAYYQIIKSADLQALLMEQTLSDFCQLHENKILYAAIYDIDGALLWQNAENYDTESVDSAAWFQAAETEIDTVAFDVPVLYRNDRISKSHDRFPLCGASGRWKEPFWNFAV